MSATAVFKGRSKSFEFIGFLGWKDRIYTLFTPLEDRIGNQDMWRLKEICSENLELMNAGIILRNKGKLPFFYKRNPDSNIRNSIIILTEPTTPLIFYAQLGGTFSFVDYFMYQYPKQSLTIEQQMRPIFDKILSLSKEILISEQARDRLLSKLMSGELEVLE